MCPNSRNIKANGASQNMKSQIVLARSDYKLPRAMSAIIFLTDRFCGGYDMRQITTL